jgi:glycosyltransferase involved in cell wall biosynthesis
LLKKTLDQMKKLVIPEGVEWELLVVNNNSTDSTEKLIKSFCGSLPIRYFFEPRRGKSNALNTALRNAGGEYILWTDDDVLVDPGWISGYCEAFERHAEAGFFGGPIEPWFEGMKPQWLAAIMAQVSTAYALRDLGDRPFTFTREVSPFGANFAVRKKEQLLFPYDPSLGPRPDRPLRGEETAVIFSMLDAGIEGWWVPGARVRHHIPQARQTTRYLRSYYFGYGEELAARGLCGFKDYVELFRAPRFLWRRAMVAELRFRLRRYLSDPTVWIEDLKLSALTCGQISGCMARRSQGQGWEESVSGRVFCSLRHRFTEVPGNGIKPGADEQGRCVPETDT